MDDELFKINFMKQNFDVLRSSVQISANHVDFFEILLNMRQHYFIHDNKTFLQLLIQEKKNIIYIIMLLNDLLKTPQYYSMINHADSDGLTAFIQMIIQRPNQIADVIKIFMSFPCFDKSVTYKGKTSEDYINESPLEQRKKDKLLKILNFGNVTQITEHRSDVKRRKIMKEDYENIFAVKCLLKLSNDNVIDELKDKKDI